MAPKEDLLIETEAEEIGYADLIRKAVDRTHYLLSNNLAPSGAIHGLKQMVSPYFDEQYTTEAKAMNDNIKDELDNASNVARLTHKKVPVTPQGMRDLELFGIIVRLMGRNGLLLKETTTEYI